MTRNEWGKRRTRRGGKRKVRSRERGRGTNEESVSRVRITLYEGNEGERKDESKTVKCRRKRERKSKERRRENEGEKERERVYSAHNSARSIGECLGRRTWTTHTVPRDHRASPLAYIRLHGSPKTIPWLVARTRSAVRADRSTVASPSLAVRYFDTVDTRLISIRYGCRGTRLRRLLGLLASTHPPLRLLLLALSFFPSDPSDLSSLPRPWHACFGTDFRVSWTEDNDPQTSACLWDKRKGNYRRDTKLGIILNEWI